MAPKREASDPALPDVGQRCTAPPAAPVDLTYSKVDHEVRGSWRLPDTGERPTWVVIEVGSEPGSHDRLTFIVHPEQTSFGGPTPPGRYFARVHARNGCGSSPPSNEISYTVP